MSKYYILKRNTEKLLDDYLREFDTETRNKLKVKSNHALILIEKTCKPDHTEVISNLWTMEEGQFILWEKYTKKRLTYDYTGVVNPLIHLKGEVCTWKQYNENKKLNK